MEREAPAKAKLVLIVEDEPDALDICSTLLQKPFDVRALPDFVRTLTGG